MVKLYADTVKSFQWLITPESTPGNLSELLENEGMTLDHPGIGMIAEVDRIQIHEDPDIRVEKVTPENVDSYIAATVAGWNISTTDGEEIRKDILVNLGTSASPASYFFALYKGEIAGHGSLYLLEKSGYLIGSSVAPEFRGKGVYRALVKRRIDELRQRHIPLATIHAMVDTSGPVCRKLGFETVCEFKVFKKTF